MRSFQFRAWDKNSKSFVRLELINGEYNFMVSPPSFYDLESWQQYTGLEDKNGKEIYEGDIVEFSGYKKDHVEIIEWENIGRHTSFGAGIHNARIIGNIYENPDLLPIQPKR